MIRLLIVDDHVLLRQALASMFEREADMTVVAQAGSLAEARTTLRETAVAVAVVDLALPDGSGVALVRELRAANPVGMVLVLTGSTDRLEYARAVEAGAAGVIHKSAEFSALVEAVRRLSRGEILLTPTELVELLRLVGRQREQEREAQVVLSRLTPREREVLQAIAEGLNDKEIAQRLQISNDTQRTHVMKILAKLEVHSRLQAFLFAIRHGVVRLP